jgi:hypothetical protein
MNICKICNKEFNQTKQRKILCSSECNEQNKKLIKRNYYLRNVDLCKKRSKDRVLNGYKWAPTNEQKEKYKEKRKKYYRINKLNNPEKIKKIYDKANNTEKRKKYMKEYSKNSEQKQKEKERVAKYRAKPSTKEVRYTDHYKRKYGITAQDYDIMLMSQNGFCKICKQPETKLFRGKLTRLAVDHCHKTGKVRGLLCWSCNTTLGKVKDSIDLLLNMANYLKESIQN